jgi:hypothetical protein
MIVGATIEAGGRIPSLGADFYVIHYKDHLVQNTIRALRDFGIPYFLFPDIYLSETREEVRSRYMDLLDLAKPNLGYFIRLDTNPDGSPLSGIWKENYEKGIRGLKGVVTVGGRFGDSHSALHIIEGESDYPLISQIIGSTHFPLSKNSPEYRILEEKRPKKAVLLSSASINENLGLLRSL